MTQPTSLADGRYLLVEQLGEGGMATVYRAFDQRLQVWRAVKILSPDYADKPKIARRFEAEAQTMALLEHPHIVRVYDVGRDGEKTAYIVMELVEGGCLVDWLEHHGAMPPKMAVAATIEVCDGLAAAHAKGVIHRDIKPHNVMVTREGMCRVTDFGIARVGDSETSQTKTGSVMGTWGYMAPEQRTNAKGVDVRSDVYAVGATLYTLVTDRMPMDLFAAERDASILEGVHELLMPLLVKSTEYSRDDRYADVAELRAALVDLLDKLPDDPPGTPALALELGESPAPPDPTQYQTKAEGPPPDSAGATILPGDSLMGGATDPAPTILPTGETPIGVEGVQGGEKRVHAMTMPPEEVAVTQPGSLSRQNRPLFVPGAAAIPGPQDPLVEAPIITEGGGGGSTGLAAVWGATAAVWLIGLVLLVFVIGLIGWNFRTGQVAVDTQVPVPENPVPTVPDPTGPVPATPDPENPVPVDPVPVEPVPSNPVPSNPVPSNPVPSNPVPSNPVPAVPPTPPAPPPEPVASAPCVKPVPAVATSSGKKITFKVKPCDGTTLGDHQLTVHYRVKGTSGYQSHSLPPVMGFWQWGLPKTGDHDAGVEYYMDGWGGSYGSGGSPKLVKP